RGHAMRAAAASRSAGMSPQDSVPPRAGLGGLPRLRFLDRFSSTGAMSEARTTRHSRDLIGSPSLAQRGRTASICGDIVGLPSRELCLDLAHSLNDWCALVGALGRSALPARARRENGTCSFLGHLEKT